MNVYLCIAIWSAGSLLVGTFIGFFLCATLVRGSDNQELVELREENSSLKDQLLEIRKVVNKYFPQGLGKG